MYFSHDECYWFFGKKVFDDFHKNGESNDDVKLKALRTVFDDTGNLISALHTLKGIENEDEDILVSNLKIDQVKKMLNDKIIINGLTLIALQWFFLNYYKS